MTDIEMWELYEQLNDENTILKRQIGEMMVVNYEKLSLGTSTLLMQGSKDDKMKGLEQLNLDETRIKLLFIVARRNDHFEVCNVLIEKYGDILAKKKI